MRKKLKFKSCAQGEEWTLFTATVYTAKYDYVEEPSKIDAYIKSCYADDPLLKDNISGIGYGWQKYVVPETCNASFSVRGAAGGSYASVGTIVDPVTGDITGPTTDRVGGRGAKVEGTCLLYKGDILYLLVGMRGHSNTYGNDSGGAGGGASVVLRVNEYGKFKFEPTQEQVEVLFVAGGGGGAADNNTRGGQQEAGGRDADYNNGTTTEAGVHYANCGGAGLTGSGRGSWGYTNPILSGNPTINTRGNNYNGGWGGGGIPYDGGAGGGGYSGGDATNNSYAFGGTSYINPTLCKETFRGYATVEADSDRNLENPWSAYGFIEIEIGTDNNTYILAKDSDGYKYFDGSFNIDDTQNEDATNEWKLLDDQSDPTKDVYEQYGNKVITSTTGLQDNVKFLVKSTEQKDDLTIIGKISKAIVKQKIDKKILNIKTLKRVYETANLDGYNVKFAVSKDKGKTWQTYKQGNWVDIDISNRDEFYTNGYDFKLIDSIPTTDWTDKYPATNLRFAFCITQNVHGQRELIDDINYEADIYGNWKHVKESEVEYEYATNDEVTITFIEPGTYKVNYLDKIV